MHNKRNTSVPVGLCELCWTRWGRALDAGKCRCEEGKKKKAKEVEIEDDEEDKGEEDDD